MRGLWDSIFSVARRFSNCSIARRNVRIGKIEHSAENAGMEGATPSCALSELHEENQHLQQQLAELKQQLEQAMNQLDWFKKQLFGQKSEKHLIAPNPDQTFLFHALASSEASEAPTEQITYTRGKGKPRGEECVTDQGLRFDADVPIERIELKPAGLNMASMAERTSACPAFLPLRMIQTIKSLFLYRTDRLCQFGMM